MGKEILLIRFIVTKDYIRYNMCRRLDSDCQYIKRLVKLGACSAPVLKLNGGVMAQ